MKLLRWYPIRQLQSSKKVRFVRMEDGVDEGDRISVYTLNDGYIGLSLTHVCPQSRMFYDPAPHYALRERGQI